MALVNGNISNERKRVKVYELRENDWFDRGTGFCATQAIADEARIFVQSEEDADRILLTVRIKKEDQYQKQQDTLIVWTDPDGVDMALSFQESEGCSTVWSLIKDVQSRLTDDDDGSHGLRLPAPDLRHLPEIEEVIRRASGSPNSRDILTKQIIAEDYISKLTPLVEMAEDLESLQDLHHLCNIMKHLILFNEQSIIEYVVRDEVILGVVGALEYDPDFPLHKANHRQYLSDASKYREVVRIPDLEIRRKIHYTYRLQYLKDVVLARILDDPTFGVLNGLIFYHQYEIVTHIQNNTDFLRELFAILPAQGEDRQRKKEAILFIQQSCAMAKNIQPGARGSWYANLVNHGLFPAITFALHYPDAAVRVAGTDILVSVIDHDASLVRDHINRAVSDGAKPITDTLVELLLLEADLGVKAQLSEAIKVLLDCTGPAAGPDRILGNEAMAKRFGNNHQNDLFLGHFYDHSAKILFEPLKALESRITFHDLSIQDVSLFGHLVDILCFAIRQQAFKSKLFIISEGLACRVAELLQCPEKHIKLTAVKFFRTTVALCDDHLNRQMFNNDLFQPIIKVFEENRSRDNLLSSACLELFEYVRKENLRAVVTHLAENYREKLAAMSDVGVLPGILVRYDQMMNPPPTEQASAVTDSSFMTSEGGTPNTRHVTLNGAGRWSNSLPDLEQEEEAYFNTSDDEEDELGRDDIHASPNGIPASPSQKPLVDYADEDEDELMGDELDSATPSTLNPSPEKPVDASADTPSPSSLGTEASPEAGTPSTAPSTTPPPNRPPMSISEKRRREEEDEDDLSRISSGVKRRSSVKGRQELKVTEETTTPERESEAKPGEDSTPKPSTRKTRGSSNKAGKISISLGTATKPEPKDDKTAERDKDDG